MVDASAFIGYAGEQATVAYNRRDLITYALGIGIDADLKYLYELHDNFSAFPTYPVVLPFKVGSHPWHFYATSSVIIHMRLLCCHIKFVSLYVLPGSII